MTDFYTLHLFALKLFYTHQLIQSTYMTYNKIISVQISLLGISSLCLISHLPPYSIQPNKVFIKAKNTDSTVAPPVRPVSTSQGLLKDVGACGSGGRI